jgi:hypothetical protein
LDAKNTVFFCSRINQPQTPTEAEDGPPELLVKEILFFDILYLYIVVYSWWTCG